MWCLQSWVIPVVFLGIVRDQPEVSAANVLEIVRKTFVYINSRAETVNQARQILLDDESISCLCVQEVVEASHRNDILGPAERDASRLPLMFFDWRGEVRKGQPFQAPGAVKNIEELKAWMDEYLIGADGDKDRKQVARLELEDMIPAIDTSDLARVTSHEDATRIRERFRQTVYPGLSYLLEEFLPYKNYCAELRGLERRALGKSDLAKHAFNKLRFGTFQASQDSSGRCRGEVSGTTRRY